MKINILLALVGLSTSLAFAEPSNLENFSCHKSGTTLSGVVDSRNGEHPSIWGLTLNNRVDGLDTFEKILTDSGTCEDLTARALITPGHALVCQGELFTPKGLVYGQVLLTRGSLDVFKDIAQKQGWACSYSNL